MIISVIIPLKDEEENIGQLFSELNQVFANISYEKEVIFVNDGSIDKSSEKIITLIAGNPSFKLINFRKNFGQTAAISAGIDNSDGDIIILMDGDLQNDPADIPKLLNKINEGFDVVSGWRKNRQDKLFSRKLPSWLANSLISKITKVPLHDYGCTLKAYRADVIKNTRLYGEMHRFIPAYASWYGAKITEIEVNHRARQFGQTKYNIFRTFKVVLDLIVVIFLSKYIDKPIHFFGKIGFWSLFFGFLSGIFTLYLKLAEGKSFISTPMPLLTVVFIIIGIQFILMGLLAEILTRIYFESNHKKVYLIKEKINFS